MTELPGKLEFAVQIAGSMAQTDLIDWMLHRIQATAPVRTGRYRAGWRRTGFSGTADKIGDFAVPHIFDADRSQFYPNFGVSRPSRTLSYGLFNPVWYAAFVAEREQFQSVMAGVESYFKERFNIRLQQLLANPLTA